MVNSVTRHKVPFNLLKDADIIVIRFHFAGDFYKFSTNVQCPMFAVSHILMKY